MQELIVLLIAAMFIVATMLVCFPRPVVFAWWQFAIEAPRAVEGTRRVWRNREKAQALGAAYGSGPGGIRSYQRAAMGMGPTEYDADFAKLEARVAAVTPTASQKMLNMFRENKGFAAFFRNNLGEPYDLKFTVTGRIKTSAFDHQEFPREEPTGPSIRQLIADGFLPDPEQVPAGIFDVVKPLHSEDWAKRLDKFEAGRAVRRCPKIECLMCFEGHLTACPHCGTEVKFKVFNDAAPDLSTAAGRIGWAASARTEMHIKARKEFRAKWAADNPGEQPRHWRLYQSITRIQDEYISSFWMELKPEYRGQPQ